MAYIIEYTKTEAPLEVIKSGTFTDRAKAERHARYLSAKSGGIAYVVSPIGHKAYYRGFVDHIEGDYV